MGTLSVRYWVKQYIETKFNKKVSDLDIIDIGCGIRPLFENIKTFDQPNYIEYNEYAIVDKDNVFIPTYLGKAENITEYVFEKYDIVYSSHLLEDYPEERTKDVILEWSKLLKNENSIMILCLPDQKRYEECTPYTNPHHKIKTFGLEYIRNTINDLPLKEINHLEFWNDEFHMKNKTRHKVEYNFIICLSKI